MTAFTRPNSVTPGSLKPTRMPRTAVRSATALSRSRAAMTTCRSLIMTCPPPSLAYLGLHAAEAHVELVGAGAGGSPARCPEHLAGLRAPPAVGEHGHLREAGLIPGRAARRAPVEDARPVAERGVGVAGRGRGARRATERLLRPRVRGERLLVELPRLRG